MLHYHSITILHAVLGVSAGSGTGATSHLQLSNWSNVDYLQLVTEKLTAFEREHKDLEIVLFGQVSTAAVHDVCLPTLLDAQLHFHLAADQSHASSYIPQTNLGHLGLYRRCCVD